MVAKRFEVHLVRLDDPTRGREIKKTRPCVVISPDEMNSYIATVIVVPMTTKSRKYPSRIPVRFQGQDGWIVLDQLRTVDKERLVRKLGKISASTAHRTLSVLADLFAP